MTGALVAHMSEASAKASVERARTHLEAAAEEVVRQINGRAWLALGYASWDEMREAEYKGAAVIVPRADRPELAARLKAEGLSNRETAETLGVSEETVRTDLRDNPNIGVTGSTTRTDSPGRERPTTYARDVPAGRGPHGPRDARRRLQRTEHRSRRARARRVGVPRPNPPVKPLPSPPPKPAPPPRPK